MREQDLLFQVLNNDGMAAEAKHWLDHSFGVHELGDDTQNKHLNFTSYDPLSFVVIILNFLREDTAPLLAPSVERSQNLDQVSSASALVKDSGAGVSVSERERPSTQRDLFATNTKAYDISSNRDFPPPMGIGDVVPGKNRAGTKPKRRIRPTKLSSAEKLSEGDITALGAFGTGSVEPWSAVEAGEATAVSIGDGAHGFPRSLDAVEPRQGTPVKDTLAVVSERKVAHKPRSKELVDTEPSCDLGGEHQETEEGFVEGAEGVTALREVTSGSMPEPASTTATRNEFGWGNERRLAVLASLYVHIMIRRFVPSLATELHLTIRLLHVHSEVVRSGIPTGEAPKSEQDRLAEDDPLSSRINASGPRTAENRLKEMGDTPELKIVFRTGLECRKFAADVLLGLKSLLPHLGADILDLLAGSLVLASQSGDLIENVRHVLGRAKGDAVKTDGNDQNTDDTAIVQSVGAPFAALQWREEDSLNNFRTPSDRSVFQNRQESVDRFGSLLRDYQVSKRGLQQYPERALQDLRTAANALMVSLAPENFAWLAQYFVGQLVGWGLAAPEETDSEVIGLVPAGDKGRLQKLHRRISTPSFGEDGNAVKSSQKLRHQPRSRQPATGLRHRKGQTPVSGVRIPTAPLQLRWFPGNQDFFYHVLLVLDSHTFNSHLKAELVAEIARLYQRQTSFKTIGKDGERLGDDDVASSSRTANEGVSGFTGTMVKLKVLAKFLGLLTFRPNWGVPASEAASTTYEAPLASADEKVHAVNCPLPLDAYLDHAWSTAGLMGAVPWMADFLRMMKWDEISTQAGFYQHVLSKLATLHSQPYMRPGHPDFTECLLAVSCEVESLFQDLGSDIGVHGYKLSSVPTKVIDFVAVVNGRIPAQVSALSAGMSSNAKLGSLDHEVVLSRRLIQNCCPYLEDILTLIKNLGLTLTEGASDGSDHCWQPCTACRGEEIQGNDNENGD
eukprot:g8932.t1